jgi:hypothetical protein
MRRDVVDIMEMVMNKGATSKQSIVMDSGSYREGFRMKGSDRDAMFWYNDHSVIWNLSQIEYYNVLSHSLILSVSSDCPPGFRPGIKT